MFSFDECVLPETSCSVLRMRVSTKSLLALWWLAEWRMACHCRICAVNFCFVYVCCMKNRKPHLSARLSAACRSNASLRWVNHIYIQHYDVAKVTPSLLHSSRIRSQAIIFISYIMYEIFKQNSSQLVRNGWKCINSCTPRILYKPLFHSSAVYVNKHYFLPFTHWFDSCCACSLGHTALLAGGAVTLSDTWTGHSSIHKLSFFSRHIFVPLSCSLLDISRTVVTPLIIASTIQSSFVTPHFHLNIFIFATSTFFSCAISNADDSASYVIAGLTTVWYNFSLTRKLNKYIFRSQRPLYTIFHCFHLYCIA